ncbi:MAG: hypothetical protein QXI22_04145 [Sulfolobales archaeon]
MISILTLDGDGSIAPSHPGDDLSVDGSPMPLGSTAIHNPTSRSTIELKVKGLRTHINIAGRYVERKEPIVRRTVSMLSNIWRDL